MRISVAAVLLLCAVAGGASFSLAQENDEDAPERRSLSDRCIPLQRVRDVRIEDDQTIIWEVRGGNNFYKMTLAGDCPGLKVRGAFVHSSSNNRLCDIGEWIRVAGGSRAICPVSRIERWTPPEDEAPETETEIAPPEE